MQFNEITLFLTALICASLVLIVWKINKERLYGLIVIFLILISTAGGKIVLFFGHETNTGNIFYASIFLATYFLVERHGKREGFRSIWVGVAGVLSFAVLLQLALMLASDPNTLASMSASWRRTAKDR